MASSDFSKNNLAYILNECGQESFWSQIQDFNEEFQRQIYQQLQKYNLNVLRTQRQLVFTPNIFSPDQFQPYSKVLFSGSTNRIQIGQEAIQQGKVGCLLIAGGQATRFGGLESSGKPESSGKLEPTSKTESGKSEIFDVGLKGSYPLSNIRKKSLFQIFFEKCSAASKFYNRKLPIAVLTSPLNYETTSSYLRNANYFGLESSQVNIFQQTMLPFLDEQGNLMLETESKLAEGPDGNGSALTSLVQAGILSEWQNSGVEIVNMVLIDNPLADPYDPEMIGTLISKNSEVVVKCTERKHALEKMGVIVEQNDRPKVIEYSELPPEASSWHPLFANLSCFAFRCTFIQKIANAELPLHKAFKPTLVMSTNEDGEKSKKTKQAWKFEKFIFDVLEFAEEISVLHFPRDICFAPLKNKEGPDGPDDVRSALLKRDREQYAKIVRRDPPDSVFELSAEFYYPTPQFINKWEKRRTRGTYLE